MKSKTIIIILVIVIALSAGIWIIAAKKKAAALASDPAVDPTDTSGTTPAQTTTIMPLKKGSRCPEVAELQKALNRKYNSGLTVDGIWGAKTQAALLANNLPTTIFWLQYSQITGIALNVNGTPVVSAQETSILWGWNPFKYIGL